MTELISQLPKGPSAAAAGECCTAQAVADLHLLMISRQMLRAQLATFVW